MCIKKLENNFIIELLKFNNPDKNKIIELMKDDLDYIYVLGVLMYNRVGAVAYFTLYELNLLMNFNREFRNSLKMAYDSGIDKTKKFKQQLKSLNTIFKDSDFNYALLKGAVLSEIYPTGLRTSNDFDILLDQKDLTYCSKILKQNGFVQGRYDPKAGIIPANRFEILNSRMNRGETVPFLKMENETPIEIDLNFSLDYKAKQENDILTYMLNDIIDFKINSGTVKTLCNEDFLIHLCLHLYKEAVVYDWVRMGRDLSLYKFLDIYLLIANNNDKNLFLKLLQKIKAYGVEKECYYSLFFTSELFNISDENQIIQIIKDIKPNDISYLDEVIFPSENRQFKFSKGFMDRVFLSKRISLLQEI